MDDLDQTVISQFTNSPRIDALVALFDAAVGTDALFEMFYNELWNLDTAVSYGLDVWGRIVGIGRTITVGSGDYFGYTGAIVGGSVEASGDSFTAAIFYEGEQITSNFSLTDHSYRQLILAKAAANITDGSIPAFNHILMDILFPSRGNIYVVDNQDMTMTVKSTFRLEPVEQAIILTTGVLPVPTGVAMNLVSPP